MTSKKSSNKNPKQDDEFKDELEAMFFGDTNNFLPLPLEELENYQDELKELMYTGCCRQIAEYVLKDYLGPLKECKELEGKETEKEKAKAKEMRSGIIETCIRNIKRIVNDPTEKELDVIDDYFRERSLKKNPKGK